VAIGSPAVLEYMVPSQTVYCVHLVGLQIHLVENVSVTASAGRRQTEVFVGPGLPRCLQLFLCGFLCCVIVDKVADTLRQRDLCRWMAVGGSVTAHIIVGPGIPRCL
jgi:hypothetical protein